MRKLAALIACLASPALATGIEIQVEGEANGTIVIDLFEDIAPGHAARITELAASGAYDNVVFHRVMSGFMAQTGDVEFGKQGGDFRRAGTGASGEPDIKAEFSDRPFVRGAVGMARAGDPRCGGDPSCQEGAQYLNSANSQFFIMFDRADWLDGNYTLVGQVTEGMDVVDNIKRGRGRSGAVPGQPDVMTSVKVID